MEWWAEGLTLLGTAVGGAIAGRIQERRRRRAHRGALDPEGVMLPLQMAASRLQAPVHLCCWRDDTEQRYRWRVVCEGASIEVEQLPLSRGQLPVGLLERAVRKRRAGT